MAINKRRLRRLVKMIDELPEGTEWRMHTWRNCALGHAAHDPWFTTKGFKWGKASPTFKGLVGGEACREFFGINALVYSNLFLEWRPKTREEMSARITKYVDGLVDHRRAKT